MQITGSEPRNKVCERKMMIPKGNPIELEMKTRLNFDLLVVCYGNANLVRTDRV